MLSQLNHHKRDNEIIFEEKTHIYTVNGDSDYKSVTTLIHDYFPRFDADLVISKMRSGKNWNPENKYYTMTDKEIKDMWRDNGREASKMGTEMHLNIENYYNGVSYTDGFEKTKEYSIFQKYLAEHEDYIPFRTEWFVYSKKYKIAGSIDMLYIDPKNPENLIIADWKRSKEIKFSDDWEKGYGPLKQFDNCNYNHYCIQLNVYRMIVEKYYGKKISEMFLVVIHPNQDSYQKIIVPEIEKPILKMFNRRLKQISA